ncbi:tonB-system energizer ExbB [Celeribacter persicus]|uniref:Biopolymer transport protein ExbB n=1 Tax=Celeribacter persicus TaxID=1651082 RepID=A0A2T5GZ53_9RHOB|nr:tonB-system energizer ExbB [Celeribacter persicus]PTQ64624.1 outer membrane transport energization protein ExbB [Celeribacter persicus]
MLRKNIWPSLVLCGLLTFAPLAYAQETAPQNPFQTPPETPTQSSSESSQGEAKTGPQMDIIPQTEDPSTAPPEAPPLAAPEPFPSPLKDLRGALDWLLNQTDASGHDLSPIGMYRSADIVVKLVMLGLIFASFVTWTVWVAKTLELWGARWRVRRARAVLAEAATLVEAERCPEARRGAVGRMMAEARTELTHSEPALVHAGHAGLKERLTAALARLEAEAGRRMARGTGVLATIGSTAPFVGLFGTVWGIMNSFISIAESNTTNLAVVAPGIAEALLATAMGLVAAIPAVVIYNLFARSIAGYRLLLSDAGERIERLVSRDLDRRAIPPKNTQEIPQKAA